jgi:enoyl-CoA hydratase/carnithine racemase
VPILVDDRPRPGGVLIRTLTLSRPDRRNALDPEHLALLSTRIAEAGAAEAVRALVITGAGTAFCSGYDLSVPLAPAGGEAPDDPVIRAMAAVRSCPLPVIARVNGAAFGAGLELAISCDVRVVSDAASFCLPPARLGIAYAPEGLARLVALVGTSRARRIVFTGEVLTAAAAGAAGLVDELATAADLDARVEALADAFAGTAPLAVRTMKRTLNALEPRLDVQTRAAFEADRLACFASEDAAEGVRAFAGRRTPVFRGR